MRQFFSKHSPTRTSGASPLVTWRHFTRRVERRLLADTALRRAVIVSGTALSFVCYIALVTVGQ
ncbi:MAG: hypothetical protein ACKPCO_01345 [Actinomycetota bacterium]